MLVTRNQIEAGVNEAAAYGAFGRRCRAHCYLKLGSSLEQNLRQGISGLEQQLDQELTQALEQRKNQAIQDGERMETKMLFPDVSFAWISNGYSNDTCIYEYVVIKNKELRKEVYFDGRN